MIYISGARPFDLESEIQIILTPKASDYLMQGIWTIQVNALSKENGNYFLWLPISEGLNPETKFLTPNQSNTLGIPATVRNIISVGSYNSTINSLSAFSGRGNLDQSFIKPDIVAPGENIYGPLVGGGYESKTGTSMAAPQVAGICALFSEWGIVRGYDPLLYGQRLKYYLIVGADRSRANVTYPNISWGYGAVCASKSFSILFQDILQNRNNDEEIYIKFEEVNNYLDKYKDLNKLPRKLFYRIPQ